MYGDVTENREKSHKYETSLAQLISLEAVLKERKKEKKKKSNSKKTRIAALSCSYMKQEQVGSGFSSDKTQNARELPTSSDNAHNASRTRRKKLINNEPACLDNVIAIASVSKSLLRQGADSKAAQIKKNRVRARLNEEREKQSRKSDLIKGACLLITNKRCRNSRRQMKTEVSSSKKRSTRRKQTDSDYTEEILRRNISLIRIDSENDLKENSQSNKEIIEKPVLKNDRLIGDSGLTTRSTESDPLRTEFVTRDGNQSRNNSNFIPESAQVDNLNRVYNDDVKFDCNGTDNPQSSALININREKTPVGSTSSAVACADLAGDASTKLPAGKASFGSDKSFQNKSLTNEEEIETEKSSSRIIIVIAPKIVGKERKKRKRKTAEKQINSSEKMSSKKNKEKTSGISLSQVPVAENLNEKEPEDSSIEKKLKKQKQSLKHNGYKEHNEIPNEEKSRNKTSDHKKREKSRNGKTVNDTTKTKHSKKSENSKSNLLEERNEHRKNARKSTKQKEPVEKYLPQTKSPSAALKKIKDQEKYLKALKKKELDIIRNKEAYLNNAKRHNNAIRSPQLANHSTENYAKESRIVGTMNWHTIAPDICDSGRPDVRSQKINKANHTKVELPSKRFVKTSVSSEYDSSSCYSSSSISSDSAVSSYSSSENAYLDSFPPSRHPRSEKHADRSPSPANGKNLALSSTGRPSSRRRASSTSSYVQYPFQVDGRNKSGCKHNINEVGPARRPEKHQTRGNKTGEITNSSPPPSPNNHNFEQKLGKRRLRPSARSIVAEGEGSNSPWHNHQLVLVSQTPKSSIGRNSCHSKSTNAKPSNLSTAANENKKNPQTIRDLYSLHNVLSDTQNGTVISGYRRNDGLRVAIKRISKVTTTRWGKMNSKTVPLELALLCQVNEARCSGVVQIVEWHETNEAYLLVMVRPHPAVDLYDYVSKHKRIKEQIAKLIIKQLVRALRDCLSTGVLHRDVKLENILLNPETLETTLIDFGCGDYVRSGPYKEFSGTPEYYPPEWFQRKQYTSDTLTSWSVGVLLYSLLCGTLPFKSSQEIREKETNKFPSDVGRKARDLIGLLLQKNPRNRLQMNQILEHPWLLNSSEKSSL